MVISFFFYALCALSFYFASTSANNCLVFSKTKTPKAVEATHTVLSNVEFTVKLGLQPLGSISNNITELPFTIKDSKSGKIVLDSKFNTTKVDDDSKTVIYVAIHEAKVKVSGGLNNLVVDLKVPESCQPNSDDITKSFNVRGIPAFLSMLPPLVTLLIAISTRQVLLALYTGVFFGSFLLYDFNPFTGFARSLDTYIPKALGDKDHAIVLLFSWMLSGMVAVISKSGGAEGLALQVVKVAKSSYGVQMAAYGMGLLIFFDDYANTLIVGNTVRPITDRFHVSREKLAFLVDCTSAPIASIAPISSWIGFELSLIKDQFKNIDLDKSAYIAFLQTIQYRFYPILLIVFVFFIIFLKRDFGPMLKAERAAREHGSANNDLGYTADMNDLFVAKEGVPIRWYNGFIPIIGVIFFTLFGLIMDGIYTIGQDDDGTAYTLKNIFIKSNSFNVLMWTGAISFFLPLLMYWFQGIMSPKETTYIWIEGMKELMEPVLILILAWSLGAVVKDLSLSAWMVASLKDTISTAFLPTVIFIFSAIISLCTGSSWSTMSIMFPIVVELAWEIGNKDYDIVIQNISSILAGSVFGDHCSPISDTTVLSALATKCDVSDHVATQAPYAILVGVVSLLLGTLPAAASSSYFAWIGIVLGSGVLVLIIFFVGKPVNTFSYAHMGGQASEVDGFDSMITPAGKIDTLT